MLCDSCGKNLRPGALFCGKCGEKIPTKCLTCGTVREEEDDLFCIKCGDRLPESPLGFEVQKKTEPKVKPEPKPAQKVEPAKPEKPPEKPKPKPAAPDDGWSLKVGKDLIDFYDKFSYKVGFVIEEEEPIDGTNFTLRAHQSKIIIWDEKQNGIKLEGFHKDGKRVSFWVNIQKNGSNDVQHQVGGIDSVVINQLDAIYTFMEYYNPKLIGAIERTYGKYC